MKYKVALFDADGVLNLPGDFFSRVYARSHGLHEDHFEQFFKSDGFKKASIGEVDLRDIILEYKDLWLTNDPNELMRQWFDSENVRNEELLEHIHKLRSQGLKVYIATVQEKYRAQYFKDVMFKDQFDGFFVSCDMGVMKPDPRFFQIAIAQLKTEGLISSPKEVFFIDDRQPNVDAALKLGIDSHFYKDVETTIKLLS